MSASLGEQAEQATDEAILGVWRQALADGGLLPPEKEISSLLGVGRSSVREALIRLEAEGFVARRHGAGTFANPAALEVSVRIDRTAEYAEILRDAGLCPEVEVLEAGWIELSVESAAALRREPGRLAFRTVKRWMADGAPMMVAVDLIPAPRELDVDPADSVFRLAEALTGRSTYWVNSYVTAVLAGQSASILGCEPSDPVLFLEQLGIGRDGDRCWWASEHHRQRNLRYGLVRTLDSAPAIPRIEAPGPLPGPPPGT